MAVNNCEVQGIYKKSGIKEGGQQPMVQSALKR